MDAAKHDATVMHGEAPVHIKVMAERTDAIPDKGLPSQDEERTDREEDIKTKAWTRTRDDMKHEDDASTLRGSRKASNRPDRRLVLNKFTLYETKTRYYIVGSDQSDNRFRVLKIERAGDENDLNMTEDKVIYSKSEILELLSTIEDGNKSSGGLNKVLSAYGIVGFIRFTAGYYISLITKRSVVALIGGHYIYHIDETLLLSIAQASKVDRNSDEARYINTFQNVDLTKNFYFSYTYDITSTLQRNLTRDASDRHYNDMFVWNHHLISSGKDTLKANSNWILPIIYGFVDQSKISVYTRTVFVTLIARRSRYFAGARFLKRGVNDKGFVANDVETEQIVSEMSTTSFHPHGDACDNLHNTSYLQHRGSIPLFWSQDTTNMSMKPPIELNVVDPFYSAAALHFDDMFARYGTPCIVLNLVKAKEKAPRESILLNEFTDAITYLNQFLPEDKKIKYIAYDMSRASKSPDENVIETLEDMAQESIDVTGFFHSGPEPYANALRRANSNSEPVKWRTESLLQNGVCRTNCIDCLDRTNAAQFVFGKCALGHQLHALGIIDHPSVPFDSDVVNMLTEMYHDHGDTIALQYGGSHLVNTMETYRKINQWSSHSRDMIEGIRRYYSNSFVDAEKQDAINLFLGNYVITKGDPSLWELTSDFFLHNDDPRQKLPRRDYRRWWTPKNLEWFEAKPHEGSEGSVVALRVHRHQHSTASIDLEEGVGSYWIDYYRPRLFTSFARLFAFNMNSTLKYVPLRVTNERFDFSPFKVRMSHIIQHPAALPPPAPPSRSEQSPSPPPDVTQKNILLNPPQLLSTSPRLNMGGVKRWLSKSGGSLGRGRTPRRRIPVKKSRTGGPSDASSEEDEESSEDATNNDGPPIWTIESLVSRLLNPTVTSEEMKEYKLYVNQFQNVELDSSIIHDDATGSHPDITYFASYVRPKSNKNALGSTLNVSEADTQTYSTFIALPTSSRVMRTTSNALQNAGATEGVATTSEIARVLAYEKWLMTGRFSGAPAGTPHAKHRAAIAAR